MENKLLLRSLFDQRIRYAIIDFLNEKMFDSRLEKNLFNYFKTLTTSSVDDKNTFLLKTRSGLSDSDFESIESIYDSYYDYFSDDLNGSLDEIEKIIKNKRVYNTLDKNLKKNNKQLCVDDEFSSQLSEDLSLQIITEKTSYDFTDSTDISLIESDLSADNNSVVKSKFQIINNSLNAGGYVRGDLICIAAASGTGKSTLALDEAINFMKQGKKVLYVTLGDMKPATTLLRILSNLESCQQRDVRPVWFMHQQKHLSTLKNLRNEVLPAGEVTIHKLLSILDRRSKDFEPDVVIIDYDGNIYNSESTHMYDYYGMIYTKLKMYAMTRGVIMFVLSQIKITEYGKELVAKECLEGSSKKQNQLDLLLTLGMNNSCNEVGTLNLAKVRDGVTRHVKVKLDHWMSAINEIDPDTYQNLVSQHSKSASDVLFG